jgi:murein DD-endopeptidase MepM/ murein hydrolase activator NlpD
MILFTKKPEVLHDDHGAKENLRFADNPSRVTAGFRIAAALLVVSWSGHAQPTEQPTGPLLSPVSSGCISSPFGPRILANRPKAGTYHNGIDMPAPAGAAVRAAAPGKVMRIQRKGAGGLEVMVQHEGFVGIYSHLGMVTPALAEGKAMVAAGEKLGVVGHSGLTYGMHVYF